MVEKAQIRRGEAASDTKQLPEGEATELNAAAPAGEGQPEPERPPNPPGETETAPGAAPTPQAPITFQPQSEDEKFLYGEADAKGGPHPMGVTDAIPPPRGTADYLPHLQRAAEDPNAPPQVKALYSLVSWHMNQGS